MLKGKVALVTGAGRGIGNAVARGLADRGATLAVNDLDATTAAAAAAEIGNGAIAVAGDVSDEAVVTLMVETTLAKLGRIDILVNNAGIALIEPLLQASVADWDQTMAVNLRAPFLLAREVVPGMIAQKRGKIINVSSQAGVVGLEGHGAYCASKGGLNMLTKVMTVEWARHNIQINSVCPTVILTPMGEKVWGEPAKGEPMLAKIPANRFGKPVEVADMILFLASSASDLVCGQDILIDGGYTAI